MNWESTDPERLRAIVKKAFRPKRRKRLSNKERRAVRRVAVGFVRRQWMDRLGVLMAASPSRKPWVWMCDRAGARWLRLPLTQSQIWKGTV